MMLAAVVAALLLCIIHTTSSVSIALKPTISTNNQRQKELINFIAGGLAGTVSSTLVQPLEVVKTQLQSSLQVRLLKSLNKRADPISICKEIWKRDGFRGFYKGLKPMVIGIIPSRAIYFWSYGKAKSVFNETFGASLDSPLTHLGSAFAAGITSNTITNPLWLVKTRYQILADVNVGQRVYASYADVIKSIYQKEGLRGFYKGLTGSYIGCFEGGIQWMLYEKLKQKIVEHKKNNESNKSPTAFEYSIAASIAKMTAIVMTYPHEVVRTRMREQAINNVFKYKGFINTLQIIAKEEGMHGLYGGLGLHLLRSVPNAAVMFVTFELVSNFLMDSKVSV